MLKDLKIATRQDTLLSKDSFTAKQVVEFTNFKQMQISASLTKPNLKREDALKDADRHIKAELKQIKDTNPVFKRIAGKIEKREPPKPFLPPPPIVTGFGEPGKAEDSMFYLLQPAIIETRFENPKLDYKVMIHSLIKKVTPRVFVTACEESNLG